MSMARRWRTPVFLNLDELDVVLAFVPEAGYRNTRHRRILASARRRLVAARDRRRRAVGRSKR